MRSRRAQTEHLLYTCEQRRSGGRLKASDGAYAKELKCGSHCEGHCRAACLMRPESLLASWLAG
eukprot:325880-Chlamydomonas_euryale.AAC.13